MFGCTDIAVLHYFCIHLQCALSSGRTLLFVYRDRPVFVTGVTVGGGGVEAGGGGCKK